MTRQSTRLAGLLVIAVLVIGGGAASVAVAAGGNPIINDCEAHGLLTHDYSLVQLQYALHHIPSSINEYGNCYDVIQEAIIHKRKGEPIGPVHTSSGGSFLPTPVIVILAVLILAALAFTGMALRARRMDDDDDGSPGPPATG